MIGTSVMKELKQSALYRPYRINLKNWGLWLSDTDSNDFFNRPNVKIFSPILVSQKKDQENEVVLFKNLMLS